MWLFRKRQHKVAARVNAGTYTCHTNIFILYTCKALSLVNVTVGILGVLKLMKRSWGVKCCKNIFWKNVVRWTIFKNTLYFLFKLYSFLREKISANEQHSLTFKLLQLLPFYQSILFWLYFHSLHLPHPYQIKIPLPSSSFINFKVSFVNLLFTFYHVYFFYILV